MIPIDPIMAAVVMIGVFIYFAVKGSGSAKKGTMSNEEFSEWFLRRNWNARLRISAIRSGSTSTDRNNRIYTLP